MRACACPCHMEAPSPLSPLRPRRASRTTWVSASERSWCLCRCSSLMRMNPFRQRTLHPHLPLSRTCTHRVYVRPLHPSSRPLHGPACCCWYLRAAGKSAPAMKDSGGSGSTAVGSKRGSRKASSSSSNSSSCSSSSSSKKKDAASSTTTTSKSSSSGSHLARCPSLLHPSALVKVDPMWPCYACRASRTKCT